MKKKYLAYIIALILVAACLAGCGSRSSKLDADDVKAVLTGRTETAQSKAASAYVPKTVYLSSSRQGAITKAANPVVGISFDTIDNNYQIEKTGGNFMVDPVYGGGAPFYVMFDSPDEIVIGDFEYGFATALSTKWEDLLHIYDLENKLVYKVVTPKDTNKIKKISANKYAVQCGNAADGYRTYTFATSQKYAYDLFMNDNDVVMIVDGGHEYDVAKDLAQESEGATTLMNEKTTETPSEVDHGMRMAEAGEEIEEYEQTASNEIYDTETQAPETQETYNSQSEEAEEYRVMSAGAQEKGEEVQTEEPATPGMVKKIAASRPAGTRAATVQDPNAPVSEKNADSQTPSQVPETVMVETEIPAVQPTEEQVSETSSEEITVQEPASEETAPKEPVPEEEPSEEELETTVVMTANDEASVEISEEQIATQETEAAGETSSTHTDIPGGRIINAPFICQFPYYPTGCESVSTVMGLQYHGIDISVDDFINNYLEQNTDFYIKDGLKYGPSPYEYFIGNPFDSSGFGCMAPVIYKALLKVFDDNKAKVVDASGLTMEELCKDYLKHDLPVMVWVNVGMSNAFDSNTWHLEDGTEYVWQANEHCMLLVGYDDNSYYFNDPSSGTCVSYGKADTERCYIQQGMQAVVIMD